MPRCRAGITDPAYPKPNARKRQSPSRPSEGGEGQSSIGESARSDGHKKGWLSAGGQAAAGWRRNRRPMATHAITLAQAKTVAGSGAGTGEIVPPVGE